MNRIRLFATRCVLTVSVMAVAGCNIQDTATPVTHDASVSDATHFDAVEDTSPNDVGDAAADDADPGDTPSGEDSGSDADAQQCADGETRCASGCTDTSSDPQNCGACNQPCVPPANAEVLACQGGDCTYQCEEGFFDLNDDLSNPDGDGCEADCKPSNGGVELCIDGVDNDCNGVADDGCDCNVGEEFECGTDVGQCEFGTVTCQTGGQPGACENAVGPVAEVCNGLDDDCDGSVDEDFSDKGQSCTEGIGACQRSGTFVCNSSGDGVTCDATAGSPTNEVCDNVDNDCDGIVDDNVTRSCGNSTGACSTGTETCSSGSWGSCQGATGPSTETCDGQDNDCDGSVDENFSDKGQSCTVGVGACKRAGTFVCNSSGDGVTCDATAGSPTNEVCDNIDNDCDGIIDDDVIRVCGTNEGICSTGLQACSSGSWGSCQGASGPSTETCDGQDNDCDGQTDEGLKTTYYLDEDDDGYGTSSSIFACSPSGDYTATSDGDCNDNDDTINPGATQSCSLLVDQDCDGDAACADSDCDGQACLAPGGGTCQGGSCVPNDDGSCQVLCKIGEYCTCGGTECCPDGMSCLCP